LKQTAPARGGAAVRELADSVLARCLCGSRSL